MRWWRTISCKNRYQTPSQKIDCWNHWIVRVHLYLVLTNILCLTRYTLRLTKSLNCSYQIMHKLLLRIAKLLYNSLINLILMVCAIISHSHIIDDMSNLFKLRLDSRLFFTFLVLFICSFIWKIMCVYRLYRIFSTQYLLPYYLVTRIYWGIE